MYQVTVHHHDKDWRNGDLEDKFELIKQENFKTRKAAKEYIERQLVRMKGTIRIECRSRRTLRHILDVGIDANLLPFLFYRALNIVRTVAATTSKQ